MRVRVGPGGLPSRESPEAAIRLLTGAGFDACEIDFGDGFWMDPEFARRLGELAREADLALSIHAPLPAFLGHVEAGGRKHNMAVGMLDHTAGIAVACGAEPVVIHPGFLLGRKREEAIESVVVQLASLRERLKIKGRAVPFGVEVMGRVQELGSLEDVVEICRRLDWVRPVIDFAHMHATSDGGFTSAEPFSAALALADGVLAKYVPFHIHFSDVSYANRNEKSHLPYGQGTLRAEPLAAALARFTRPATVISESPDDASNQTVRGLLQRRG
jgi:deoxyribonuclease-4